MSAEAPFATLRESGRSWQGGRVPGEALFGPPRPFSRESGWQAGRQAGCLERPFLAPFRESGRL